MTLFSSSCPLFSFSLGPVDPSVENPGKNTEHFFFVLGSSYTKLVGLNIRAHTSNFYFHERACLEHDFFSSFSCKSRIRIKILNSPISRLWSSLFQSREIVKSGAKLLLTVPLSGRLEQARFEGVCRGAFLDDGTGRRPIWGGGEVLLTWAC